MKNPTKKILSISLAVLTSLSFTSPVMAFENDNKLEEVRVKRINKKGNLIVKFRSKLKDFEGSVKVDDKDFKIKDADIIKPRKIVWQDVNLPKQKGDNINTDNLIARYYKDKDNINPLRVIDDGECGLGILPLLVIGAGIAAGSGSSGGSGSSSSN